MTTNERLLLALSRDEGQKSIELCVKTSLGFFRLLKLDHSFTTVLPDLLAQPIQPERLVRPGWLAGNFERAGGMAYIFTIIFYFRTGVKSL